MLALWKDPRKRTWLCAAVVAALLLFIWGQSLASKAESSARSGFFAALLARILGEGKTADMLQHLVRKCAHAFEYACLGFALAVFAVTRGLTPQRVYNALTFALIVAVLDESLQILSARGPGVDDVLLDMCGAAFGLLAALFIRFLRARRRRTRERGYGRLFVQKKEK